MASGRALTNDWYYVSCKYVLHKKKKICGWERQII
jgi:hypothetical protein